MKTDVEKLRIGPKTKGTRRTTFNFRDGTHGDIYLATLKAIASTPPQLKFEYRELNKRIKMICTEEKYPAGSSMVGAISHMKEIAKPNDHSVYTYLDWDHEKQILDIPSPYFMFYIRWSDALKQTAP